MFDKLEKNKEKIQDFVLMDDTFFSVAFEDNACCEEFLRIVTGINNLCIEENKTQYSIRNVSTHSVILDLLAKDSMDNIYCIEIQKANDDDHQRRVRFNQANIDVALLDKGVKYEKLPTVISIFVSKTDIMNGNKACYHVERVVREMGKVVYDGREEIYINATNNDGSKIAELMKEFTQKKVSLKFPNIAKRVDYLKHDDEGVMIMCELMQDIVDEAVAEEKRKNIIMMIQNNEPDEKISLYQNVSLSDIAAIRKELLATKS